MAELRGELAAAQRETVPAAQIQRAVALFNPIWDLFLVPERFRITHLLIESVVYDGATGAGAGCPISRAGTTRRADPPLPRGRIPRVARLLALAYHFQELLDTGTVEIQAENAELAKLTPTRVTQSMSLLGLDPGIQEEIFFLPPVTERPPAITERHLRQVLRTAVWSEQRERWAAIRAVQ
jgi:hypothetical protein